MPRKTKKLKKKRNLADGLRVDRVNGNDRGPEVPGGLEVPKTMISETNDQASARRWNERGSENLNGGANNVR